MIIKKNIKRGNNFKYFLVSIFLFISSNLIADEKIRSTPLINLEKIKPSFEESEEKIDNINDNKNLLKKKKIKQTPKFSHAVLIGLDKITAKSSEIIINLDEKKNFGPLEIKILKCGKVKVNNEINDIAYMQVKDLSKTENEKVFIFNGWTFSSDPNLTPFDHAIYDLQLINCYKA